MVTDNTYTKAKYVCSVASSEFDFCVCKITVKERVRFWREIDDRVALGCDDRLCTQKVIAREKKVDRVVKGSWNRISLIRARGCQKT